jgi:alkylation response protein AidB-like acyl-CoA dehydrogenase
MVDLHFTREQDELRRAFADLFSKHASIERVRSAEPLGYDERLWMQLVNVGAPLMGVPEPSGGMGASALDTALAAYELGRHIAPAPMIEAMVAANLLAAAGGQDDVLAEIATGAVLPTIALGHVTGEVARMVPAGAVADLLVVLRGDELLVSRRDGARPHVPAVPNLADAPIASWDLDGPAAVIALGKRARRLHADAVSEWQVLTAAALSGLGTSALELGVNYVKQRHAFGVPLGWFQSVQHRLADVATAGEGAELLCWEAAWARATGDPRAAALAIMALLFAGESAFQTCRASLQFHGGYGYTLEYDIQLFFRRAKAWPLALGPPAVRYQRLADLLYRPGREVP